MAEEMTEDQVRALSNIFGLARWLLAHTNLTPTDVALAFMASGSAILEHQDVDVELVSLH